MRFWGESEHFIDDKGRVILPVDYRNVLGNYCVLTRGPDKVVILFPVEVWEEIQSSLYKDAVVTPSRILQRLFSSRTEVKIDNRGRMSIPRVLRDWANITVGSSVILLGQGQSVEIWSKEYWLEYQKNFTSANTLEAAQEMGIGDLFRLS